MNDRPTTDGPSLTSLVSGIVTDVQKLVHQEIQLARTEIKQEWDKAKSAAVSMLAGVLLLTLGGLLLGFMLVYLVNWFGVPLWGSFGIVGGAFALLGLLLAGMGYAQARRVNVIPPQTVQSLKENVQWIQRQT
jgi:hypothetical protein